MSNEEPQLPSLVERLREFKPYRFGGGERFGPVECTEAADEIERLTKRVAELEESKRFGDGALDILSDLADLSDPVEIDPRFKNLKWRKGERNQYDDSMDTAIKPDKSNDRLDLEARLVIAICFALFLAFVVAWVLH